MIAVGKQTNEIFISCPDQRGFSLCSINCEHKPGDWDPKVGKSRSRRGWKLKVTCHNWFSKRNDRDTERLEYVNVNEQRRAFGQLFSSYTYLIFFLRICFFFVIGRFPYSFSAVAARCTFIIPVLLFFQK